MMLTREAELWAATRTLAMHQEGGRCAHCHRDGCRLKVWAHTIRGTYARAGYPPPDDPVTQEANRSGAQPIRSADGLIQPRRFESDQELEQDQELDGFLADRRSPTGQG